MAILGLHELAHFVLARHHHVEASLPYFIPVPPPFLLFGTFGAFISLREPIPTKKALLDIGAAGPLAGFVVAIPVTLGGLLLSAHSTAALDRELRTDDRRRQLRGPAVGPSLIWEALGLFVPASAFAHLHPLALAGWVGLLVTAINLLPAGQLDGGHVFRALFGDRARSSATWRCCSSLILGFRYEGWFLFALLVFVLGVRHPPPLNDITPLDGKRWALGGRDRGHPRRRLRDRAARRSHRRFRRDRRDHARTRRSDSPGTRSPTTPRSSSTTRISRTHGYLVSGTVSAVYATVNGTSQPLATGGARRVRSELLVGHRLPFRGDTFTFSHIGGFSIPSDRFPPDREPAGPSTVGFEFLNTGGGRRDLLGDRVTSSARRAAPRHGQLHRELADRLAPWRRAAHVHPELPGERSVHPVRTQTRRDCTVRPRGRASGGSARCRPAGTIRSAQRRERPGRRALPGPRPPSPTPDHTAGRSTIACTLPTPNRSRSGFAASSTKSRSASIAEVGEVLDRSTDHLGVPIDAAHVRPEQAPPRAAGHRCRRTGPRSSPRRRTAARFIAARASRGGRLTGRWNGRFGIR